MRLVEVSRSTLMQRVKLGRDQKVQGVKGQRTREGDGWRNTDGDIFFFLQPLITPTMSFTFKDRFGSPDLWVALVRSKVRSPVRFSS